MPEPPTPLNRASRILSRVIFAGISLYLLVKLAPHLAAMVGVETGGGEVPEYSITTLDGRILSPDTSFLVDRTGRVRHKALGPLAMVSFEPAVRRLLAEEIVTGGDPD